MTRLLAICWKEFVQLRRDRMTLGMMIGLPVVQLMLFGYAINSDVRHIPTVVFDQDRSVESRDLVARLEATGFYDIAGEVTGYEGISLALTTGRARVALVVPPDFGAHARVGRPTTAQLVLDGSDPQTVASASNTAAMVFSELAQEWTVARIERSGSALRLAPARLEPTTWYNPELVTAVYVVPGLVGVILTMTMVMLTSMALVRERERGTMEQLIVSPIKPIELVVGKIVPYILIGYVQMSLVLLAGRLLFDVPIRGSLPLLYALAVFFIAACLALGLFFSTIATTQQQAMQMSFFFLLPNILLSGFMFPFEGMPRPAQYLSQAMPLTHFLRIIRTIVLKGGGFAEVQGEFLWLVGILCVLVVVTSLRFNKRLA
jgi:ABC-2 type transport system permease protein